MIVAFQCQSCPSDTGTPEFLVDDEGYTVLVVTCIVCGEMTT